MQKQEVKRQEVEELLGFAITDELLQEALECVRRKQEYIYQLERRPVVLQHWYLVKLTEEYVRSLALSKFTMDLRGMEKEHSASCQSAPTDNFIVAGPAG